MAPTLLTTAVTGVDTCYLPDHMVKFKTTKTTPVYYQKEETPDGVYTKIKTDQTVLALKYSHDIKMVNYYNKIQWKAWTQKIAAMQAQAQLEVLCQGIALDNETFNVTSGGWATTPVNYTIETTDSTTPYITSPAFYDTVWNTAITDSNCLTTYKIDWNDYIQSALDPKSRLKLILRERRAPAIRATRFGLTRTSCPREQRARETLKLVVGDEAYQRFLRSGFVVARNSSSGRVYQIFPGHQFTRVYENGQCIEQLCVVLKGNFPPTDALIVRYLMALNNEARLWQLANKQGALLSRGKANIVVVGKPTRTLPELFSEFKQANNKTQPQQEPGYFTLDTRAAA
jgi:hypothetical protein